MYGPKKLYRRLRFASLMMTSSHIRCGARAAPAVTVPPSSTRSRKLSYNFKTNWLPILVSVSFHGPARAAPAVTVPPSSMKAGLSCGIFSTRSCNETLNRHTYIVMLLIILLIILYYKIDPSIKVSSTKAGSSCEIFTQLPPHPNPIPPSP